MAQVQRAPGNGRAFEWARDCAHRDGIVDHTAHSVRLPRRAAQYARDEGVNEGTISARLTQLHNAGLLRSRKPIVFDLDICSDAAPPSSNVIAFPRTEPSALTADDVIVQLIAQRIASDPTAPQVPDLAAHLHELARRRADLAGSAETPREIAETARFSPLDQTRDLEVVGYTEERDQPGSVSSPRGQRAARGNRAGPRGIEGDVAEITRLLAEAHTDWGIEDLTRWFTLIEAAGAPHGLQPRPRPLEPLLAVMTNWGREACEYAFVRLASQLAEPDAHRIRNPWALLVDIFTNANDGYLPPRSPTLPHPPSPAPATPQAPLCEPVDFDALVAVDSLQQAERDAAADVARWEADPEQYRTELERVDSLAELLVGEDTAHAVALRHLPGSRRRVVVETRLRTRTDGGALPTPPPPF